MHGTDTGSTLDVVHSTVQRKVLPVIYYRAVIDVPAHVVGTIASLVSQFREEHNTWRKISPEKQAVLALARLKNNDTFPALAASFSVGLGSAWRYADEVITILAGQAPNLVAVLDQVGKDDTLLIDGTLIRTDRVGRRRVLFRQTQMSRCECAGHL